MLAAGVGALALGLLTYDDVTRLREARTWVEHSREVIAAARDLSVAVREAERGQREFLITGQDDDLAPFRAALERVIPLQDALRHLTSANPAQQARLRAMAPVVQRELEALAQAVEARRRGGANAAHSLAEADLGRQRMGEIEASLGDVQAEERGLLTRRQADVERADARITWFALSGFGLLAGLLALCAWVLARPRGVTGQPVGTARMARIAALREREARLRDLLATLNLSASMARDLDGTIRHWSEGCARLYGWTAAEAVGRNVYELLRTEFPIPPGEIEAALERDGEWVGDLRHQTRDGRELVIAARKVLRRGLDNLPASVMESLTDVTEHRRAEAALAESEARFRAITDAMPQMVWATRPDGRTDHHTARCYEFTGLPKGSADDADAWASLVHPDDMVLLLERWQHSQRTRALYEVEHRLRRRDGAYRWVLARAVPILDGQGRIVRWFGTLTDIEEIVEAREVLARSRAELERLVDERTRDLEETQARLAHARRMEALGQLAGGIAHDFNNVLQTVQGSAELIERRTQGMDDVRRLARMVGEAAERGSTITRRLLAFSRRGELRAEAVDAAALLGGMRDILGHTLGGTVEVRVEAEPGLPMLLADKGQLETVLVNLATNARDAMPSGGTLTFSAALAVADRDASLPQAGRLAPLKAGRYVRLSAVDTGEGMTPEILAHVTEPFFTTKQQGRGTGLGLAMAKGFAEQSGGALGIESAPARGTTVTLWFPVTAQPQAAVPAGKVDGGPARGDRRARILLVDDDPIVREVTAEQLEAEGYAVVVAESGAAALEALDAGETVDLVVSDLSMPGLDGIAVIREAQRRKTGLPAILLTGFATDAAELAVGGALSGCFSLLRKPVMAEQISERVGMLLETAAAINE